MTVKHLREILAKIPMADDHRELNIWLPNRDAGDGFFISLHGEPERFMHGFVIEGSVYGAENG